MTRSPKPQLVMAGPASLKPVKGDTSVMEDKPPLLLLLLLPGISAFAGQADTGRGV